MPAAVIRLIITMALLLVATMLSPLAPASADQGTDGPSAEPTPSDSSTPSPTSSAGSATPSSGSSAPTAPSPTGTATGRSARAAALTTTVHAHPDAVSTRAQATFTYSANLTGAKFRCRLKGPGLTADTMVTCPGGSAGDTTPSGTATYTGLKAGRTAYHFTVQAYLPNASGAPAVLGAADRFGWRVFTAYSPDHYSPRAGTSFNRPLSKADKRTNLTKVIRTVNSMPGYRQAYPSLCPALGSLTPSTIRISSYSISDDRFARALIAAHKRCISVQVLMNNHLTRSTDPAWRKLEDAFGTKTFDHAAERRSFAHRCSSGCRGTGVMHTKMYLFNSTMHDTRFNTINVSTMTGSSNMTSNAAKVQWNDLYTVRGRADLYATFLRVYDLMKRDNGVHRTLIQATDGPYQTTFWPQGRGDADPAMSMLRSVRCQGANGGTGIGGRSIVYINMHAWFGTRGNGLANQVRKMYNAGCYVRVLYSFMSYGVYQKLHKGTNGRMSVRRTTFSHNGRYAYVYSHLKNTSVSGYVGNDRSAKVTWTGSNNFTNDGTHFDEVTMRIASGAAYNSYVRQFKYMSSKKSSAVYANFEEPKGGGRAPRRIAGTSGQAPAGTPVIRSGAITVDGSGEPHALD